MAVLLYREGLEEQGRYSYQEYDCKCNQEVSDPEVDSDDYEVPEPDWERDGFGGEVLKEALDGCFGLRVLVLLVVFGLKIVREHLGCLRDESRDGPGSYSCGCRVLLSFPDR